MSEKIYLGDCDLPKDENGREHGLCIWRDIHKKVFCVNNYDHDYVMGFVYGIIKNIVGIHLQIIVSMTEADLTHITFMEFQKEKG